MLNLVTRLYTTWVKMWKSVKLHGRVTLLPLSHFSHYALLYSIIIVGLMYNIHEPFSALKDGVASRTPCTVDFNDYEY